MRCRDGPVGRLITPIPVGCLITPRASGPSHLLIIHIFLHYIYSF